MTVPHLSRAMAELYVLEQKEVSQGQGISVPFE